MVVHSSHVGNECGFNSLFQLGETQHNSPGMVWSMLTPWRTHPTAQEGPGSLLLREGDGGATFREPCHTCPSSSGEDPSQPCLSLHSQLAGLSPMLSSTQTSNPLLSSSRPNKGPPVCLLPPQESTPIKSRLRPQQS